VAPRRNALNNRVTGTPAFAVVAAVVGLALAASATPSPLYGVYQAEWGFSTITLTLVYAVYAIGVLGALLLAGRISDQAGRKPTIVVALSGLIVSTVLFSLAESVAWLYAARALQGLSTGVALGAAGAAMIDLHPLKNPHRIGLVNGVVSSGGLGVGALASSALVQYVGAPQVVPFVVLAVIFATTLVLTLALPEPIEQRTRPRLTVQRPRIPSEIGAAFLLSALGVLASWSVGGIYLSLGPQLASEMLHTHSHLAGGIAIAALTFPAVVSQLLFNRLDPHRAAAYGALVLAGGMVLIVLSLGTGSGAFFVAASAITGFGWGVAFLGALRSLTVVIPPAKRAEVMSAFYVVAYSALAFPAIIAGIVVTHVSLDDTFRAFGLIVAALALVVAALAERMRRADRARAA
jgi:MFS family permease